VPASKLRRFGRSSHRPHREADAIAARWHGDLLAPRAAASLEHESARGNGEVELDDVVGVGTDVRRCVLDDDLEVRAEVLLTRPNVSRSRTAASYGAGDRDPRFSLYVRRT
jgi:hypothetical protein